MDNSGDTVKGQDIAPIPGWIKGKAAAQKRVGIYGKEWRLMEANGLRKMRFGFAQNAAEFINEESLDYEVYQQGCFLEYLSLADDLDELDDLVAIMRASKAKEKTRLDAKKKTTTKKKT